MSYQMNKQFYHVDWLELANIVKDLTGRVINLVSPRDEVKYPNIYIYPIRDGGVIPSAYLSYLTEIPISEDARLFKDNYVLVVDDVAETGFTLYNIQRSFTVDYSAVKVYTLTLFTKPWCRYKPDITYKIVDQWVVFPWETGLKNTDPHEDMKKYMSKLVDKMMA